MSSVYTQYPLQSMQCHEYRLSQIVDTDKVYYRKVYVDYTDLIEYLDKTIIPDYLARGRGKDVHINRLPIYHKLLIEGLAIVAFGDYGTDMSIIQSILENEEIQNPDFIPYLAMLEEDMIWCIYQWFGRIIDSSMDNRVETVAIIGGWVDEYRLVVYLKEEDDYVPYDTQHISI